MSSALTRVMAVYMASDADATRQLYADLSALGPIGELAVNLLRASKKSERAKIYRRRGSRAASYDGKQWAMDQVCTLLLAFPDLVTCWGWGIDPKQEAHRHVLYVDLPTGQVSFHTGARGRGPAYPGEWDGRPGVSAQRACNFAARVLDGAVVEARRA